MLKLKLMKSGRVLSNNIIHLILIKFDERPTSATVIFSESKKLHEQ